MLLFYFSVDIRSDFVPFYPIHHFFRLHVDGSYSGFIHGFLCLASFISIPLMNLHVSRALEMLCVFLDLHLRQNYSELNIPTP